MKKLCGREIRLLQYIQPLFTIHCVIKAHLVVPLLLQQPAPRGTTMKAKCVHETNNTLRIMGMFHEFKKPKKKHTHTHTHKIHNKAPCI